MTPLAFDFEPDLCTVESCDGPRTHRAVCDWTRGVGRGATTGRAVQECCLWHANYFAESWLRLAVPPYSWPGVRDVVWMERLEVNA